MCFTITNYYLPCGKKLKKSVNDLFFISNLFLSKNILAFINQLLQSKLLSIRKIPDANNFFFNISSNVISVNKFIFCRSGTANKNSLKTLEIKKLLFNIFCNLFEMILDSKLAISLKP